MSKVFTIPDVHLKPWMFVEAAKESDYETNKMFSIHLAG